MKIRLIGTPEECLLALARLRNVTTELTVSDPYPSRGNTGQVRLYVTVVKW